MIFALLPVKDPRNAKQRLNGVLSASEREGLARAMCEQMLGTLSRARGIDRVAVVTSDAETMLRARRAGALVFEEERQLSHSASADEAARRAMAMGAATVLLLPIDVALATPVEIEQLASVARAGVTIVPSADGTGTNALVRTPPDAIPSRFGPGSFAQHVQEARARGLRLQVLRPPGLLFDIDTPEDVAELLRRAPLTPIAQLVRTKWASAS